MNINNKHKRTKLIHRMFNETMISMIFTEISLTVATMVDGFTVSRFLGHEAMAALGLVAALPTFIALVAGILNSGAQGIAAKKLAESDVTSAKRLFNFILFFSTVVGLIVTGLIILFSDQVLITLGVKRDMGNVWMLAKNYLYGLSFSIVANIIIISIMPFLYLDGARKRVTTAITFHVIINVILDFVVVLILHRGIFAIGLVTSIAVYIEFFCFAGHFLQKDTIFKPSLKLIDFSYILPVLSKGMPIAVRRAANIIRKISINRIIATVASSYGLAALATQNNIKDFGDALGVGIGLTTLLLAGITIGEQNKKDVRELLHSGVAKICMLIPVSIGLGVIAKLIAMLYSNDAMTIEYTTFAIRAYACSLPLVAMNTMYSNYLQGSGNIQYANLLGLFQRLICIVPSVFIFSRIAGIKGTFIAFPVSEILVMICIVIFIQVKTKKFRIHFDDFLLLPADFGVSDENQLIESVYDKQDVISLSEKVSSFCKEKNLDSKKSFYLSLLTEEIGMNIIEHGFQNAQDSSIDFHLVYDKDGVCTLSFKDNCRRFDPHEYKKVHEDFLNNKQRYIGMRIIFASAKEIKYVNTLKMNCLMVKI